MIGSINPFENPQVWDVIRVGQVVSPGLCDVGEFLRSYGYDIKKGKGMAGAKLTLTTKPPTEGSFELIIWTPAQARAWDKFLPLLDYDPSKTTAKAIDIYHPALADIGVKSIVVKDIGSWMHKGKGKYSRKLAVIEYFPESKKNVTSSPNGSKSTQRGTTPGAQPDPIADAKQREIARLLAEAAKP